jgi:hypothetical protein
MADRNVCPTKNQAQRGADIPVCHLSEQTLICNSQQIQLGFNSLRNVDSFHFHFLHNNLHKLFGKTGEKTGISSVFQT